MLPTATYDEGTQAATGEQFTREAQKQMSGFGARVRMKLPGDQDTGMQRRDRESLKMTTLDEQ
jgi:hypothetical protein